MLARAQMVPFIHLTVEERNGSVGTELSSQVVPQGQSTCPTISLSNEGGKRGGCGISKPKWTIITEKPLALCFPVIGKGLDL